MCCKSSQIHYILSLSGEERAMKRVHRDGFPFVKLGSLHDTLLKLVISERGVHVSKSTAQRNGQCARRENGIDAPNTRVTMLLGVIKRRDRLGRCYCTQGCLTAPVPSDCQRCISRQSLGYLISFPSHARVISHTYIHAHNHTHFCDIQYDLLQSVSRSAIDHTHQPDAQLCLPSCSTSRHLGGSDRDSFFGNGSVTLSGLSDASSSSFALSVRPVN